MISSMRTACFCTVDPHLFKKVVQGTVDGAHIFGAEIDERFGDQLALCVIILHAFGQDGARVHRRHSISAVRSVPHLRLGHRRGQGRECWSVPFRLVNLHRLAVKLGIIEEAGGVAEIHDREMGFIEIGAQARAAADNLLELGHGVDHRVQDDQVTGLGVDAGGQHLRGGGDDRVLFIGVDEIVQLLPAVFAVAGDAHHIAVVIGRFAANGVDQLAAHAFGVGDVDAEDDRLVDRVGGLRYSATRWATSSLRCSRMTLRSQSLMPYCGPR